MDDVDDVEKDLMPSRIFSSSFTFLFYLCLLNASLPGEHSAISQRRRQPTRSAGLHDRYDSPLEALIKEPRERESHKKRHFHGQEKPAMLLRRPSSPLIKRLSSSNETFFFVFPLR